MVFSQRAIPELNPGPLFNRGYAVFKKLSNEGLGLKAQGVLVNPTLTDITQLNYSFEVIVLLMKYSLFCNEGCIDLNSSALLKASAPARDKGPN